MKIASYDMILKAIEDHRRPLLIAIDGRACSGKSTLAGQLIKDTPATSFNLDDLFIPFSQQAEDMKPAFPFPYFRYPEFLNGIRTLREGSPFKFLPYDWHADATSSIERCIEPSEITVVEGVSATNEETANLFDLRIFVVSDQNSQFDAAMARDGRKFERFWKDHWLPSEELFFQTQPWTKADFLYPGRGVQLENLTYYL